MNSARAGKIPIVVITLLTMVAIGGALWYFTVLLPQEELDAQYCHDAKANRSLQEWRKYLTTFPNGKCSREARDLVSISEKYGEWVFEFIKRADDVKIAPPFLYSNMLVLDMRNHNLWTRDTYYTKPHYMKNNAYFLAEEYCQKYSAMSISKWRIPSLSELDTLKMSDGISCHADTHVFPNICNEKKRIWSSDYRQGPLRKDYYAVDFRDSLEVYKEDYYNEAICLSSFPPGMQNAGNVRSGDNWVQIGLHAWEVVPPPPTQSYGFTFTEAKSHCISLKSAGLRWRLPTLKELNGEAYNTRTQSMDTLLKGPDGKNDWYWADIETHYIHYRFVDPTWGKGFNYRTVDTAGQRGLYGNNIDLALVRCVADLK